MGATATIKVVNMDSMFENADLFNDDSIVTFQTPAVTSMNSMFKNARDFNQPIRTGTNGDGNPITDANIWKTNAVTDMTSMFEDARAFNPTYAAGLENLNFYVGATSFVLKKTMSMFKNARVFDKLVFGSPHNDAGNTGGTPVYFKDATSQVTDMTSMFEDAYAYNQETQINTGYVSTMVNMFRNTDTFNLALTEDSSTTPDTYWNVAKVTDMTSMFEDAVAFDAEILFVATNLEKTNSMFKNAVAFNKVVFGPPTSVTTKVTDMASMFEDADAYNQLFDFYTDKVTSMNSMFKNANVFNQNINKKST